MRYYKNKIIAWIIFSAMCLGVPCFQVSVSADDTFSFINLYEDFESYGDKSDTTKFPSATSGAFLKNMERLNAGNGWSDGWYDNSDKGITGNHKLCITEARTGLDLYSSHLGTYPIMRDFVSTMDFSKGAEYYVSINAMPSIEKSSVNLSKHNLTFKIGDISFGTKYVEGKTTSTNGYYYPHLSVDGSTYTSENGYATAAYHNYYVKITVDAEGKASIDFSMDGVKELDDSDLSLTNANCLIITDNNDSTARVSDITIEGYSKAELDNVRKLISDYAARTVAIETVNSAISSLGTIAQRELNSELFEAVTSMGAIEDFESYADADNQTLFAAWDSKVKLSDCNPANGGTGWDGGWYDNGNGTVSGNHQLRLNDGFAANGRELDLYAWSLTSYPLSRKLSNPIDFTKKGEYYISVKAMPSIMKSSVNFGKHNLSFSLGDSISFGTKYVEGQSTSENGYYYPSLSLGEETLTGTQGYATATYYNYLLNIITDGNGGATVRFKLYTAGSDPAADYTLTANASRLANLDTFSISDTNNATSRVSSINIEYYSDSRISAARDAIDNLAKGTVTYDDAYKIVNAITGLAKEHLLAELEDNNGYLRIENGEFKSVDGVKIIDSTSVGNSLMYNFKIKNNFKDDKHIRAYLAVYYDRKLSGVRSLDVTAKSRTTTDTHFLGFTGEGEDVVPPGEDTKRQVKVFLWQTDTVMPYDKPIEMYSLANRAVHPTPFAADTDERITVAFMGDSITHSGASYAKWVEYYYRLKYPNKDIIFANKGISGESCANVVSRFNWDILNGMYTDKPDEATLMIGMNDVNRSLYPDGDENAKQSAINNCLKNIRKMVALCEENNIKLTLITPALYDENESYSSYQNNVGVNAALGKVAEGVIEIANENNLAYIDFYGAVNNFNREIRAMAEFESSIVFNGADRIHPISNGQFAEGFIFINQQIHDSTIASVEIDVQSMETIKKNALAENVTYNDGVLSYRYSPASLPFAITSEYTKNEDEFGLPLTGNMNREIIRVTGLEEGTYLIKFGDTIIGEYTSSELALGINIALIEVNPGQIQSQELYELVAAKTLNDQKLRDIAYVERSLVSAGIDLSDTEKCIAYATENDYGNSTDSRKKAYVELKSQQETLAGEIDVLEAQAKSKAIPLSYTVQIIRQ